MKFTKFAAAIVLTLAALSADASASEKALKVKVVVDEEYKKRLFFGDKSKSDWKEHIRVSFEIADREFERQFGRKIVVTKIVDWPADNLGNIFDLLLNLKIRFFRGNDDFVVGFTGRADDANGAAYQDGRYAVISAISGNRTAYTLMHEIGHLCGADHVADEEFSVMSVPSSWRWETFKFDRLNFIRIREGNCLRK